MLPLRRGSKALVLCARDCPWVRGTATPGGRCETYSSRLLTALPQRRLRQRLRTCATEDGASHRCAISPNADAESIRKELREGLPGSGYVEGENLHFEIRSADGKLHLLPKLAAELVAL
jgi:hypothetical protein